MDPWYSDHRISSTEGFDFVPTSASLRSTSSLCQYYATRHFNSVCSMFTLAWERVVLSLLVVGVASVTTPRTTQEAPTPTLAGHQLEAEVSDRNAPVPLITPQTTESAIQQLRARNNHPSPLPPRLQQLIRDSIAWLPISPTPKDPNFSITCSGSLPPSAAPSGSSEPFLDTPFFYKDLTDLCAFHGLSIGEEWGLQPFSLNVGCACR